MCAALLVLSLPPLIPDTPIFLHSDLKTRPLTIARYTRPSQSTRDIPLACSDLPGCSSIHRKNTRRIPAN